ncbi:MAG: sensor histidine kinase [Nitrospirota bacterium]
MTEKKEIFGISQIQLLRHEIHQPNITLHAKLVIIVDQLNLVKRDFGKNNLELSQRIDQIIGDAEAASSYSTIFATIIENIFSTFDEEDAILYNVSRCNLYKIILESQRIFVLQTKNIVFKNNNFDNTTSKHVEIDKGQIMRAFINIYQNAIKFSYYGSKDSTRYIETDVIPSDKKIKATIKNYGTGILRDEIPLIFQKGYRGKLASDRHRTGAGIGLFEVKKIIEAHHGKVEISSYPQSDDIITGPYLTEVSISLPYFQNSE